MKAYRNVLLILATLLLALALSLVALAEPPEPSTTGVTLAGTVASKISYQGRLTDAGGNPLNGSYNLVFQLWDDATAGSQVGGNIVRNGVPVNNGLFTVDLDVPQDAFNGQALWLRIQVGTQWLSPRQELLPVPYALGLRPGARIEGNSTDAVASVVNQGLGVALYAQGAGMGVEGVGMTGVRGQGQVGVGGEGLTGVSGAGSWVGVYGESAEGYGVRGNTGAPMTATVAGVYGSGDNAIGVMGTSITGTGGFFASTHGTGASVETLEGYGLYVQSGDNIGIYAHSGRWTHPIYWFGHIGVFGNAEEGVGVQGMGQTGGYFSGQQGVRASGTMTGVTGTADNMSGRGVIGIADNYGGIGVYGSGGFGIGVQGEGEIGVKGVGSVGPGVWGQGATGVYGTSQSGFGMDAVGNDASNSDRVGDLLLGGNIGEIFSFGHLGLYVDHDAYIDLDDDNNDANAKFAIFNGTDAFRLTVDENGNLWAWGAKSAVAQTNNYGQRLLYAVESTGVWFEDFGSASLVNGEATVTFEPIFAETVNLEAGYHVFLTPLCQEPVLLFVTAKNAKGFTVRGVTLNGQATGCTFDYRLVAKRLGYEGLRLEPATVPTRDGK